MKAKKSSRQDRSRDRDGRGLTGDVVFPVEVERRALGWVFWWLRLRRGWSAKEEAKVANVGEQTVRDAEKGTSKDLGWTTALRVGRALKRELPWLERLAHRFIRRDYHRQKAAHEGEPNWKMVYAWRRHERPPFKKHGIAW